MCAGACSHADCARERATEDSEYMNGSADCDNSATEEEYASKQKAGPNQRQRRRGWEGRTQEDASRGQFSRQHAQKSELTHTDESEMERKIEEPNDESKDKSTRRALRKRTESARVSNSEALNRKVDSKFNPTMGTSAPLGRGVVPSEGEVRERALTQLVGGTVTRSTWLFHPMAATSRRARQGKCHRT